MSAYTSTGDEVHVSSLERMARAATIALAVIDGELSADDAGTGRVGWNAVSLSAPIQAAAPQQFAFTGAAQIMAAPPPTAAPGDNHAAFAAPFVYPASGPISSTGVRFAKAAERFDRSVLPTTSRASPYEGLAWEQVDEVMRADATAPRGWMDRPTEA